MGCSQLGGAVQAGFKARELGELRETLRGQCPMETIYFNKYFSVVPFLPLKSTFHFRTVKLAVLSVAFCSWGNDFLFASVEMDSASQESSELTSPLSSEGCFGVGCPGSGAEGSSVIVTTL